MRSGRAIRIIAAIASVWQAIGVATYLSYTGVLGGSSPPPGEPDMPLLVHACYAIGVFAGLAGAVGLALLRRWARPLLWLSLAALIVDWGWVLTATDAGSLPLGIAVLLVATLLVVLAESARRRGLLS